jgi:putative flippase GtrA
MKRFREFIHFGLVGALGFVVDTAVLYLLRGSIGLIYSRPFSFLAAVFSTWLLNRNITFRERTSRLPLHQEFSRYLLLMLAGGAVNVGLYTWLILHYESVRFHPFIGVGVGGLAGMGVNLAASRVLLFRFPTSAPRSHID